jgi:7-cyano-7-deazaguanine synthase in queuosine biosynthesis
MARSENGRATAVDDEGAATILLMLSGGIDSTYLLYDYLQATRHRIHAHHISIRYPHQQRWRAEDPASERVVAWFRRNLREFEYTTSRFDLDFHRIGWDSDLQLLVASKVALNLGAHRIRLALGWCADDLERRPVRERLELGITAEIWRSLRRSTGRTNLDEAIAMPIIEQHLRKVDLISRLPRELFLLTWSCRSPSFLDGTPHPCGRCHACQSRLDHAGATAGE